MGVSPADFFFSEERDLSVIYVGIDILSLWSGKFICVLSLRPPIRIDLGDFLSFKPFEKEICVILI